MKKFFLITGLWLLLSGSAFCPAEEFQVEVKEDQYGGNLYSYLDRNGNKCMTNSVEYLPGVAPAEKRDNRAQNDEISNRTKTLLLAENRANGTPGSKEDEDDYKDEYEEETTPEVIADPLEGLNRLFFSFNDKLYFYFLKPVASGYRVVLPAPVRTSIGNFFENIIYPVRFVGCLLQAKIGGAFVETGRFLTNSTIGLAGLFDPATSLLKMEKYDEDFGQTLGVWGIGHGFYINLPIWGPSSLRDGIGIAGDIFLDPLSYLAPDFWDWAALWGVDVINTTSFRIGDYEDLKKAALDPYVAIRDAYVQLRAKEIAE